MNKSILFVLLITTLSYGMEDNGLYLVVGSTRDERKMGFPAVKLWQANNADISHINTYGGKATTMDIQESCLSYVKHISADARTYEFEKNSINAAYLERLPTMGIMRDSMGVKTIKAEKNYLGSCIQNIGNAMKPNAIIEIEWHPYGLFINKGLDKIQSLYDAKAIQRNPFNATIDISLALQSVDMACYNNLFSHDVDRPKKFLSCAEELSTKVKNMITFYEEKNVGARDLLIERLVQEIAIVRELIENDAVLLSHGPSASLEAFTAAVKGFLFIEKGYLSQPIGTTQTIIDDGEYFTGTLYDLSSFLSESLFNFIVCDVFIEDNSCYVKEFMHSNGFKDVTIERTTSPHNGRTNVWIIKGIKS